MKALWCLTLGVVSAMCLTVMPSAGQAPKASDSTEGTPPPVKPVEIKTKAERADPSKKPTAKKSSGSREKKSKKEAVSSSGFDPKSFLLKLVMNADDDDDGVLSVAEFRNVPLLKELKSERVDSLFVELNTDKNAGLDTEEISKGFGKITSLAKEHRALLDDDEASKQVKKIKQLSNK